MRRQLEGSRAVAVAGVFLLAAQPAQAARPAVSHLETNSLENPLGIGGEDPRLSWQLASDRRGTTQTAYQIRVTAPGTLSPRNFSLV